MYAYCGGSSTTSIDPSGLKDRTVIAPRPMPGSLTATAIVAEAGVAAGLLGGAILLGAGLGAAIGATLDNATDGAWGRTCGRFLGLLGTNVDVRIVKYPVPDHGTDQSTWPIVRLFDVSSDDKDDCDAYYDMNVKRCTKLKTPRLKQFCYAKAFQLYSECRGGR